MQTAEQITAESKPAKQQAKTYGPRAFEKHGRNYAIEASVRFDTECGNGHNSFAVTADIMLCDWKGNPVQWDAGGCCHDEVSKHFPELAPLVKWHLCSTDGPMHYVANTIYLAGNKDCSGEKARELDGARRAAVWPDATDVELSLPQCELKNRLLARLPALLTEFRAAVESLGFTW